VTCSGSGTAWATERVSAGLTMATFRPMAAELFTERLHLRPWRASDAEPHRQLWTERDRRSPRLIDAEGRPTVEDLRERMADESPGAREGLGLFAIERLAAADFIGYCGLIVGQASLDEPEIAYELARRVHGNGYATEAAGVVVAEAAATGRSRLWATVREWNAASFRVLEKVGFEDSGRVTPDPERGDSIWMTRDLTRDAVALTAKAALSREP
jgi:RimJ/RimL family protein N-acetyltransferase